MLKLRENIVWTDLKLVEQFGGHLEKMKGEETTLDFLIRKLLRIRVKKGGIRYLRLNRAQQEYSRRCTQRNIVLKARQVGITTYIAARFFIQTITRPGTVTVQVAHNDESAEAIFKIVHRFWEKLPNSGLQRGALLKSRSNVRQIVFPRLDSEYRVETADNNAGRGMTIHNLHCSEVSRWPRGGEETLASLRAAVVPDGEVVLESTPRGASGLFYEEWQKAGEQGYTKHFFPWWYERSYKEDVSKRPVGALTDEEKNLVAKHGLTPEQIAWRRTRLRIMKKQAAQEFAEDETSCFLASGECVFDLEAIDKAGAEAGPVVESRDNERCLIWLPPHEKKRYIIGVDAAGGGTDGDYACAQVIDRASALQCAEWHGHFPPYELARHLVKLGRRFGGALIAVERNNHGYGVLAHLKELGYENLFVQDGQEGWLTSVVSRPAMIERLGSMLVDKPNLFQSERLLGEMKTFVRYPDGRSAAAEGAHDDCVMAMAIAQAVRNEASGQGIRRRAVELASVDLG
ncbi:MAG TPA: terminase [Candidatus Sulfotelmatobacter sp.]|nr:terminase [Candidatus Sulfotelmatobacter sp.]